MAIPFNETPATRLIGGHDIEVDPSFLNASDADRPVVIVGGITSDATVAQKTVQTVYGASHAAKLFGAGSQLHNMVEFYRALDPTGSLLCIGLDDAASSVAATGNIVIAGTATEAGTLDIYIGGEFEQAGALKHVQVAVANGDAHTAVATALKTAIDALTMLPVTAGTVSVGTVPITANNKGTPGNSIPVVKEYRTGEKVPAGLTVTVPTMGSGATDPTLSEALAVLGDQPVLLVVHPYTDTTNLNGAKTWLDSAGTGRWAPGNHLGGHAITASLNTASALETLGAARNDPAHTIFGLEKGSPSIPWCYAAHAAARLRQRIETDPGRQHRGRTLPRILPAPIDKRFDAAEREALLDDGISTHTVVGGVVAIEQVVTTWQTDAQGQASDAFRYLTTRTNIDYQVQQIAALAAPYSDWKLGADGSNFDDGQAVMTPKRWKGLLAGLALELEEAALVESASTWLNNIIAEKNGSDPNRLDALFPPNLINNVRRFATLVQPRA